MRRVLCRTLSAITLASALFVLVGAVAARAQSPTSVAWWSKLALAPPTVPPGGLFIANDPLGPTAFSAVRVETADQVTLTLHVASGAVPPPSLTTIVACPITSPWQPPPGGHGDAAEAPRYDCSHASKGMVATDNKSISWLLPSHDVALVPDPTGQPVPFAVAFAPPDDTAVLLSTGPPAAVVASSAPAAVATPPADVPAASVGAPAAPPAKRTTAPAAADPQAITTPAPQPVLTAASAPPVGLPLAAASEGVGQRIVAGLALLGLAAGWWFMSSRSQREPRLLVTRP
jgi:hypothetical protein